MEKGETYSRAVDKLKRNLGPQVLAALREPGTLELMLNADGCLWHEKQGQPMEHIGTLDPAHAEGALRTLAGMANQTITPAHPSFEGTLPFNGARIAGQVPPIVDAAQFCIRMKPSKIYTLDEYEADGVITASQHAALVRAVQTHKNILIAGSTGSGKTTLVNALIHEMTERFPNERFVLIEDTPELQCAKKNAVRFETHEGNDIEELLRITMRMRPDRILVGEVRDKEAKALLTAWNSGHRGGVVTLHADSAEESIDKLEILTSMHPNAPRTRLQSFIAKAIDVAVFITRSPEGRVVKTVASVNGFNPDTGYDVTPF